MIPVFAETTNGFYANDNVKLKKGLDTTTFVAGNNIDVKSNIDGASFVAGNNITLSSSQDYLFAAGNSINIENATTKDAFVAGSQITITSSTIRDLYAAGQNVRIDSEISRNAYLAGDTVTINGAIYGDATVAAENIRIGKEAIITGTLKYPEDSKISISESAEISTKKTYKGSSNIEVKMTWVDILKSTIYSYLSILLIAFILLSLGKKIFTKISKLERTTEKNLKMALQGLGLLIITPIAAVIVMITIIGFPLSIITLLLWGICIYLSIIPTSYYIGKWLLEDKVKNDYLLLAISILVIKLLGILPVIGGLVTFVTIILGLGIIMNLLITQKKK